MKKVRKNTKHKRHKPCYPKWVITALITAYGMLVITGALVALVIVVAQKPLNQTMIKKKETSMETSLTKQTNPVDTRPVSIDSNKTNSHFVETENSLSNVNLGKEEDPKVKSSPKHKVSTPVAHTPKLSHNAMATQNKTSKNKSQVYKSKPKIVDSKQTNMSQNTTASNQSHEDKKPKAPSLFGWFSKLNAPKNPALKAVSTTGALQKEKQPKEQKPVLSLPKVKKEEKLPKIAKAKKPKTLDKSKPSPKPESKKMLARITVYWAKGSGTDPWSAKKQSSTGTRLECSQHAAVDPKIIPYGSKIKVKNQGKEVLVKAVDTGSAVKQRKAAIAMAKSEKEKMAPVVDLFFEKKSDALNYAKSNPAYQWVSVQLPN
jgi:3D (Asp-Asp-Asp) domain-containing protein